MAEIVGIATTVVPDNLLVKRPTLAGTADFAVPCHMQYNQGLANHHALP
jgi:hypothetical protein